MCYYSVDMKAQIHRSINNMFTSRAEDGKVYQLRIKGKVLQSVKGEYNPLAVGDFVEFEPYSPSEGLITSRLERRSSFSRWNVKAETNQTISANMDQVAIVTSVENPPFRPKFLDRAICSVKNAEILIVVNKADLEAPEYVFDTLDMYESLGYKVVYTSAEDGDVEELLPHLEGRLTAFVGQSGVGKSSLINLIMGSSQRTGEISEKYNRGRHTTNFSQLLEGEGFSIIDTPGVREILVPFEDERLVKEDFPELRSLECGHSDCLHNGEEGCLVPSLIEEGRIDEERYISYLRILESLEERRPIYMRKKLLEK